MINFILNNETVTTELSNGTSLLDYIRDTHHLKGTKIGCREGDCGACTVLQGRIVNKVLSYKSIVSCLTPLINAKDSHIVTIEGLNLKDLSPVQNSIVNNAGTQCGFCTPGFVVALTGHMLSNDKKDPRLAISGNICRCTGYKSIEKAAFEVEQLKDSLLKGSEIETMINKGWLPEYFQTIGQRLKSISSNGKIKEDGELLIGGGTDLLVQQPENICYANIKAARESIPDNIEIEDGKVKVGAAVNMSDFFDSQIIKSNLPQLEKIFPLIASEQIRNMGTLAGNIVNASPIGDISILLLALDAELVLVNDNGEDRQLKLCDFFLDYKLTELLDDEFIHYILIPELKKGRKINFEKVSKRTYLDIATVNSAISIQVDGTLIKHINFSAGGLAPIPKKMINTNLFLTGKKLEKNTLRSALEVIQAEISPISDIRGSEEYKRLLIRQLFLNHILILFPEALKAEDITDLMQSNI